MSAVIGILLFALAVLIFGAALVVARKPSAPDWLTQGFAGSLVTITSIAFAVTGLGLVGQFAVSYGREPLGAKEILLISIGVMLLVVVFVGIVKALRRSPIMTVAETSTVANAPFTSTQSAVIPSAREEDGSSMPVKHDPSHSGRGKRFSSKRAA